MDPLSSSSKIPQTPMVSNYRRVGTQSSLSSRVWAVAVLILVGLCTAVAAAPLQRRYDGGINILQPDFSSLKPLVPEFGPFYSPQFSCLMQKPLHLRIDQSLCSSKLTSTDLVASPKVCPVQVDLDIGPAEIPREIMFYVNAIEGVEPVRNRAARHFPENLSAFMFNELGLFDNGNKACKLKEHPEHYLECADIVETLVKGIKAKSMENTFKTQVLTESAYRIQGYLMGFMGDDQIRRFVSFGINPENHVNYKKAIIEIEEKILGNDCFFNKDPEEILGFIKNIHGVILNNLPAIDAFSDDAMTPGIFRKETIFVFKTEKDKEKIAAYLREEGATEKEIKLFKNSYSKLRFGDDFQQSLSRAELKVWRKVLYFAPPHEEIEKLMSDFVVKFKQLAQQEIHPVALAAWVHCELGRIHPFSEGNGRLSRLLLNTILVRGGYEPVIFFDDDTYTQAVSEDDWTPGAFAVYLAKLITEQAKAPLLMARV